MTAPPSPAPSFITARVELAGALMAGALLLAGLALKWTVALPVGQGLFWGSLGVGMFFGLRAALESLRRLHFDIDVLMVVGAGLAGYVGAPGEGALLLFLFVLSGALEDLAMGRARRAVEALHKLMPTSALRMTAAGEWETVEPESLGAGDRIKVLPGETIPADCRLLGEEDQAASVDQSSLTGESIARVVRPGEELFAGTINVGNPLEATVARIAAESSLQRILDLVISAQEQREPVQRIIDRFNRPYAVGVMTLSVLVLLVWWLVFGVPLVDGQGRGALYTAITLLIVASPCAVVIATPTATLAAITRGARAGVLFKGGQSIERLARLGALGLDKTGTLTVGRPRLQHLHAVGWSRADELLSVAAGLEQDSTHPIAAAIRDGAKARSIGPNSAERAGFSPGGGVSGMFDGVEARLGTYQHAEPLIPVCLRARTQELMQRAQERGQIGVVVAYKEQAAVIVLSDELRIGATQLVARLHALGVRPVVMLTGDNRRTAESVASQVAIDRFMAEMLPEGKVAAIADLKRTIGADKARGPMRGVGIIGDGVNDAPALAAADVSIAIGSIGSDAALESADIVLLGDDLLAVPWAVRLARRARRVILVNLSVALGAIVAMVTITLIGSRVGFQMPLWAGVLGHEGGTLLVVANSLLLLLMPGARAPTGRVPVPEVRAAVVAA